MCPTDTTPDPRGMERMPEAQCIPQGRSTAQGDDARQRPPLPDSPLHMPADDEDGDPE